MTQTRFLHVDLEYTLTLRSADPERVNKHLLTLRVSADEERDPRCLTAPDMKAALTYDAIETLRKDIAKWGPFTVPSNYAAEGQLRAQVASLQVTRDTQATTIQKLQRQLDENSSAAASRVIELERQLREAEDGQYGELRKLREQVGTLRDQLTAAEKQVVSLRGELDTQAKRIDAIRRLVPRGHRHPFALTEELVASYIQLLKNSSTEDHEQKLTLERRLSMLTDERDAATRERDQLKNQLQVSNTSNAHLQKHNDTLVRHLTSLRNLVPVEFRSALATPEEEVGQYIRQLQSSPLGATGQLRAIRELVPPSRRTANQSTLACVQDYIEYLKSESGNHLAAKHALLDQRNRIAELLGVPVGTDLSDEKTWVPDVAGIRKNLTRALDDVHQQARKLVAQDKQLDAMRAENDRLREELRSARRTLTLAITSQSNRKFENNLFYGEDLREKLTKAEAKVQKLTERLAKCGMARAEMKKQFDAERGALVETTEMRRLRRALAIVMTHHHGQAMRNYAAASSAQVGKLHVGVVTRGPKGEPVEHHVRFDVMGFAEDGLVTGALREVTG